MKHTLAVAFLMFSILPNCQNASAAGLEPVPAKYADPVKQLEAEIDMATRYASELEYCIKKLEVEQTNPVEFNKLSRTKQEFIDQQRSDIKKAIAGFGGNSIAGLEGILNAVLYGIYETASGAAARFHLGEQETITVRTLRAAINDESKFVVPICSGKPTFSGSMSRETYSSTRKWFSVPVPKSSNLFNVPFSIQDKSVNSPEADYDLVKLSVKDFGELLIAAVENLPAAYIESRMKQSNLQAILSELSLRALHSERSFPVEPEIVDEAYFNTPHGEALLRIYKAEKGSLIVKIDGKNPAVSENFETLIAVIAAVQKNNFIYAYAENDAEGNMPTGLPAETKSKDLNKEALKKRVQAFFSSMTVNR